MYPDHRSLRVVLTSLVLGMAGSCASAPSASEDATPVKRDAPAPAPLRSCLNALETHPADGELAATQAILDACAPVWSEKQCQDAWRNSMDKLAGLRASWIMTECGAAYCPEIDVALCTMNTRDADLTDPEVDWLTPWVDFNQAILEREIPDGDRVDTGHFARSLLLMISMTSARHHVD